MKSLTSVGASEERVRQRSSRSFSWPAALHGIKIRWALAAVATLLLLLGGAGLLLETSRLRNLVLQAQADQSAVRQHQRDLEQQLETRRQETEQLSDELARARDQLLALESQNDQQRPLPTGVLSFFLTAGLPRGNGEPQKLTIPSGIQSVNLRLTLKRSEYPSYRAAIKTPEGIEIWSQKVRPTPLRSGATLVLQVPANRLIRNDYVLKIIGTASTGDVDEVSSYYFRVER
jgi:hypothetical protein